MIEETPMNLTAAQVAKGSPQAATELQAAGANAENERVASLTAAFGDDQAFLTAAIADKSMTVDKAKAKKFDELKPAHAALVAENTKLKATASPVVGFAPSDKDGGSKSALTADQANEASLKIWNANEQLRTEFAGQYTAFAAAYRHEPELYTPKK